MTYTVDKLKTNNKGQGKIWFLNRFVSVVPHQGHE